jgi:putative nucleotidyltransferase with HDIG domain
VGPRTTESTIADQVRSIVLERVESDDLILPAMPQVVAKCLALLDDPDLALADVARLIETDPIVAARIVRLANVAARAPVSPIRSLLDCVNRLGLADLRTFLLETAARRVFESADRQIGEICHGLWEHSLAVALLSRDLLKQAKGKRPEEGYLAGLLHDIGKPVMAAMLLAAEMRLRGTRTQSWFNPATWLRLISEGHRRIGVALAEKWALPDGVRIAIHNCAEYDPGEPCSTANAVRLANALAKSKGVYVGETDAAEVDTLVFVGRTLFGLDEAYLKYVTTYLGERVKERLA